LIGDPTEGALWVLAQKGGLSPGGEQDEQPRIAEIPFDSAHKFMATFHHAGETWRCSSRARPMCCWRMPRNGWQGTARRRSMKPMRAAHRGRKRTPRQPGLRVLAVARRVIPARDFDPAGDLMVWAQDWTFLGLAGLMDPPRAEAARPSRSARRPASRSR
jgi:P-type Ca2+ transporter type 2C